MTPPDQNQERRQFSRIPFNARVRIQGAAGIWSCNLIDISFKGVLVERPLNMALSEDERFRLELPLENSEVTIQMEVHVAHSGTERIGFICDHINLESIAHLKRLMELNLGDAELVPRELSALG